MCGSALPPADHERTNGRPDRRTAPPGASLQRFSFGHQHHHLEVARPRLHGRSAHHHRSATTTTTTPAEAGTIGYEKGRRKGGHGFWSETWGRGVLFAFLLSFFLS